MDVQPAVDRFRSWLREHDLPATPQRMAIAEIVLNATRPLSAEDVARRLGRRGARAGTATVYRTLDVLVKSGLARGHADREGFRRFEPYADDGSQEQLLCTVCGAVEVLADDELARLVARAAKRNGFTLSRHRLVGYGTCRDCAAPRADGVS